MEYFWNSIKRPFTDWKKLIIGIIISILPIVNFMAMGYQIRCAKTSSLMKLPKWDKFGQLFVTGLFSAVILLIYLLPGIIIFGAALGTALVSFVPELQNADLMNIMSSADVGVMAGIFMVIGLVLMILGSLIGSSAIIGYSQKLKFKDGFIKEVFRKAFTSKFFFTWVLVGIYGLILSLVLSFIPDWEFLNLGSSIRGFLYGVTYMTALGTIYKKL
jgi:magnesium-transporting ATPase (P-type)